MDNQFVLRRAVISDINALSQLHQRTYQETFVEDLSVPYPAKDLDSFFRESSSPEWFANKIVNAQRAVWVIEDKTIGELVALAVAGSCNANDISHPDVCSDTDGVLNRLFVRRDRHGRGFGQRLMNTVLLWLAEHYPKGSIWLNVLSQNVKAQKFYKHYGFTIVGDFHYYVGEWKDTGFIMKRETHSS